MQGIEFIFGMFFGGLFQWLISRKWKDDTNKR